MSERVTIEVPGWFADLFDRGVQAGLILVAAAAAGFAILGLAWSEVAAKLYVSLQMPYVVSGAVGGVAVAGASLAILAVHVERRLSAEERAGMDGVIGVIGDAVEVLPARIAARRAGPALVRSGRTVHRPDCRMAAGRGLPRLARSDRPAGLSPCGICTPKWKGQA